MITEKDLQEAIAECQGERNPNANTCIKLAAFYTIRNEMYGKTEPVRNSDVIPEPRGYSFAPPPEEVETTVDYYSDTEFGKTVDGRKAADIWPIVDELAEAVKQVSPRLYDAFMRKLV